MQIHKLLFQIGSNRIKLLRFVVNRFFSNESERAKDNEIKKITLPYAINASQVVQVTTQEGTNWTFQ